MKASDDTDEDKLSIILTELRKQGAELRKQGGELRSQREELTNLNTEVRHRGVMIEHLTDQQQAMLEIMVGMQQEIKTLPGIRADLEEVKTDIKVIKAAVIETNKDLHTLERRVDRLEASS